MNDLVAAISVGTLQISVAISFAALIFTDDLSEGVPRAAVG